MHVSLTFHYASGSPSHCRHLPAPESIYHHTPDVTQSGRVPPYTVGRELGVAVQRWTSVSRARVSTAARARISSTDTRARAPTASPAPTAHDVRTAL